MTGILGAVSSCIRSIIGADQGRQRLHVFSRPSTTRSNGLVASLFPAVAARRQQAMFSRDLPFAADLLSSVLRAGLPIGKATTLIAYAVEGPVGEWFRNVAAQLSRGVDPQVAWNVQPDVPRVAFYLAQEAIRTAESGAALADSLSAFAEQLRHQIARESESKARRASVGMVLPLVCCFLPAFVIVGILPIVMDLARQALTGE